MKKICNLLILMTMFIILLAACAKKELIEETVPATPPKEIEEVEVEEEEEEEVIEEIFAPFSGRSIEEENDMRPVLVTINNDPKARPQSGINEADIIYEFMTEGMTTRFLALFQSALPDVIGPVRSSRDMFVHMASGLDAFYVAHGYSPDALALLQANVVDHINGMQYDGTLFKRSADRYPPHNSYISNENIFLGADKVNARMTIEKMPSFSFYQSIEEVETGEEITSFTVNQGSKPHFTSNYVYDKSTGTYERTVNGAITKDKETDETTQINNVLVFETAHETIDSIGRQRIDIESGGKAMLFQAGMVYEIEWENKDGILMPIKHGQAVSLLPGKTWIHIVRNNPGIETIVSLNP